MKKLTFEVTIEFTENIKDGEIREVTQNLTDAIYDCVERGWGLAPEENEAITKSIKVRETISGIEAELSIF
jgi:UDP-galactopyranose mutase